MSSPPSSNSNSTPGPSPKLRVLVVDDQEAVRTAIAGLLTSRGFESVAVGSGEEALERLRTEYFDVMVCDVRMPGMSGLDTLSAARELERGLPVLMLTAANDLDTARGALEQGAMDYLSKPIGMDDLASAVHSAAQHRRHELKRVSGPQPVVPQMASGSHDVELVGGPLDARRVKIEDARYRLWVVMQADGEHVWASADPPSNLPEGSRAIGSYVFSAEHQSMLWTPDRP